MIISGWMVEHSLNFGRMMTVNNRFQLAYETNDQYCIWWAVRDGDITLWKEEVVSLLNQLNQELKTVKELHQLWMNEALTSRETINSLKKELAECKVKLQKIENKQIKADKFVKSKIHEINELENEAEEYNLDAMNYQTLYEQQLGINKELKQSNKDAWNLIRFIYNEIKEDGYMDWGRIQDLVEF